MNIFFTVTGYYIITNKRMIKDEGDGSMKKSIFHRKFILSLLVLCFGVLMSACSSNEEVGSGEGGNNDGGAVSDEPADDQTLRLTQTDEISSMDTSFATDAISHHTLNRVMSGLLVYEDGELVPELAKDMPEVNDDKTEYTFELRDDAEWSNGEPIVAEDFEYAWHRALDKDFETQYDYIFEAANIKNASKITDEDDDMYGKTDELGIEAVDEDTVKVTLDKSTPERYFNSLMQFAPFFPLNEEFVEEQGDSYAEEPENILYSGPFVMDEWQHGEGWTLKKNEDYFDKDDIKLDEVDFKVVKDPNTELKLYENGEIDHVELKGENVAKYKDDEEYEEVPDSANLYWKLDQDNVPEFKNEKIRQAISLSIDRESMVDVIMNDGSIASNYFVPKDFAESPDGEDFHAEGSIADTDDYPTTDKEKAQELWEEGKEEEGFDTLDVEFLTTDQEDASELADYFVEELESNLDGLELTINKQPFNSYQDIASSGEAEIDAGSGWGPDYEDPMTFLELFTTNNSTNTFGISDDKYDELIEEADELGDEPEKRWEKLQEAEKHLIESGLIVPVYQSGQAQLTKDYVDGYEFQTMGTKDFIRHIEIKEH